MPKLENVPESAVNEIFNYMEKIQKICRNYYISYSMNFDIIRNCNDGPIRNIDPDLRPMGLIEIRNGVSKQFLASVSQIDLESTPKGYVDNDPDNGTGN